MRAETAREVEGYARRSVHTGELRARRAVELAFEVEGRVLAVHVDEGTRVAAGDVLAALEDDRVRARIEALEAGLAAERARLSELEAGPRAQTLAAARAELRALSERRELAASRLARRVDLVAKDALAEEQLDEARTAHAALTAELDAARARLDELEEGTRAEALERQRAVVAELTARVDDARTQLADHTLRAPFDGVVTHRRVDEGRVVAVGDAALRLLEDRALEARVGLPPAVARGLETGQALELEVGGERVPATITALVPELERGTRTVALVAALDPAHAARRMAGEAAVLALPSEVRERGLWLPTEALVPGTHGLWAAYAVVPDADGAARVERRDLEVLYSDGPHSLVRGTLSPGERVVVEGVHRVVPGQRVVDAEAAR